MRYLIGVERLFPSSRHLIQGGGWPLHPMPRSVHRRPAPPLSASRCAWFRRISVTTGENVPRSNRLKSCGRLTQERGNRFRIRSHVFRRMSPLHLKVPSGLLCDFFNLFSHLDNSHRRIDCVISISAPAHRHSLAELSWLIRWLLRSNWDQANPALL